MPDPTLHVGEWLPDQPQNENPGVNTATNVLPLTERSYTPFSQFVRSATAALPTAPLGATSATDNYGNAAIYTGTAADLYILTSATKPNFSRVSSAPGAYAVPSGGYWSFAPFGTAMYASNGSDPIQSAPLANAAVNFSTVDANAPKAKVIASIMPGFLLCGNINDVTLGILPAGVRWSSLGSAGSGSWPLVGSAAAIAAQSDGQNIIGDIGQLRAIAPNLATCNAALFFDKAVFRMIYTGDSSIFAILPVEKLRGTRAPQSVVTVGQVSYYLGSDGFYSFDGTLARPIGYERVNRFFFTDADPNFIAQVQGATDPTTGLVYWAYSSSGFNGIYNRILVYNPNVGENGRFSLITAASLSNFVLGLSIGIALDNITTQLGYTLDALPYSLDSAILSGGNLVLAGFDSSFYFGFFTGSNTAFQVETTEIEPFDGRKARVSGIMPLVEGDTITGAVGVRSALAIPSVYGPSNAADRNNVCPARVEGRFVRAMLTGALGNSVQHVKGCKLIATPAGSR